MHPPKRIPQNLDNKTIHNKEVLEVAAETLAVEVEELVEEAIRDLLQEDPIQRIEILKNDHSFIPVRHLNSFC